GPAWGDIDDDAFHSRRFRARGEDTIALFPDPFLLADARLNAVAYLIVAALPQGTLNLLPDHVAIFRVDQLAVGECLVLDQVGRVVTRDVPASLADKFHCAVMVQATAKDHARQMAQGRRQRRTPFLRFFHS